MKTGSCGFTLIELMVVIVIMGLLSSILAPKIPQLVNKAKEGKIKGNMASLRTAINVYYSDNEAIYPTGTLWEAIVPRYLKDIPELDISHTGHGKSSTIGQSMVSNPPLATSLGTAAIFGDAGIWCYCEIPTGITNTNGNCEWGELWVGCTHTDMSGIPWTAY